MVIEKQSRIWGFCTQTMWLTFPLLPTSLSKCPIGFRQIVWIIISGFPAWMVLHSIVWSWNCWQVSWDRMMCCSDSPHTNPPLSHPTVPPPPPIVYGRLATNKAWCSRMAVLTAPQYHTPTHIHWGTQSHDIHLVTQTKPPASIDPFENAYKVHP